MRRNMTHGLLRGSHLFLRLHRRHILLIRTGPVLLDIGEERQRVVNETFHAKIDDFLGEGISLLFAEWNYGRKQSPVVKISGGDLLPP